MKKHVILGMAMGCAVVGFATASQAAYDTVYSRSFNQLCPTMVGGDREYNGHGPEVTTQVALKKSGPRLYLFAHMHQRETVADWSEALLERDILLSERTDGTTYTHVWAADVNGAYGWRSLTDNVLVESFHDYYVDTNHLVRRVSATGRSWLAEVATQGDTLGNDIGNCTSDDAYLSVRTNPIYVWYE
jgi:hypothetical protein